MDSDSAQMSDELAPTVRRLVGGGLLLAVVGGVLVSLPIFLLPLIGILLLGAGFLLFVVAVSLREYGRPTPPRAVGVAAAVWVLGGIALFVTGGRPRPLIPAGALAIALLGYPLGVSLCRRQWAWVVGSVVCVAGAAAVTVVVRNNPFPMSDLFGVLVLGGVPGIFLVALGWRLSRHR